VEVCEIWLWIDSEPDLIFLLTFSFDDHYNSISTGCKNLSISKNLLDNLNKMPQLCCGSLFTRMLFIGAPRSNDRRFRRYLSHRLISLRLKRSHHWMSHHRNLLYEAVSSLKTFVAVIFSSLLPEWKNAAKGGLLRTMCSRLLVCTEHTRDYFRSNG